MKKLSFSIVTATLIAAVLSACGGGGSDSSGQAGSDAASAGTTGDSSLAYLAGTYVFPCKGVSYETSVNPTRTSDQGTIVIKPNAATGKMEVNVNIKAYEGSTNCEASTLDTDLSGNFTIRAKSSTKIYMDATGNPVAQDIDGATGDWSMSGDAMRWSPELAEHGPAGSELPGLDAAVGIGAGLGLDMD